MPLPVRIPRVNNNDDIVRISSVLAEAGGFVQVGEILMEVESDKAVVTIEAEQAGYVLAVLAREGEMVAVGAVAAWLGQRVDEPVPEDPVLQLVGATPAPGEPTAKARLLLQRYGLSGDQVPRSGDRLTVADVEAYAIAHNLGRAPVDQPPRKNPTGESPLRPPLSAPSEIRPASPALRGMISSVSWQREHAASAYLETRYDPVPWELYAAEFARTHRLLFSPLLALMACRLAGLAAEMPSANATVLDDGPEGPWEVHYKTVNLGFTVQAGDTLYLVVLANAEQLDETTFVMRLADLQRRAMARKLAPAALQGATIGFSSMARWGVARHIPVLAPRTSVMVAHTISGIGNTREGVLGATYDHRMLSGFGAAQLLRALASPNGPTNGLKT